MTKWNYYRVNNYKIYFANIPSKEFVCSFIEVVFGIKNWDTNKTFNKKDNIDIIDKMLEMLPVLTEYLRPFIINNFFYNKNIHFNRCVTLLHNFILIYGYNICYETKIEALNYKYNVYRIYKLDEVPFTGIKIRKNVIMYFDND